jgi:hypothetical protein
LTSHDPADEPIEVHLPDGGQVIVAFEDRPTRDGEDGADLVASLFVAEGTEGGIAATIREEAHDRGLDCTTAGPHPTVIHIGASSTRSG